MLAPSATPILRPLRTAPVGLQDLSPIATTPVMRRPIRTPVAPLTPDMARDSLARASLAASRG